MMKSIMKGAATIAIIASIGIGTAVAQACEETQFSSANAEDYLKAETELMVNENPQGALAALNALRAKNLNCYEQGAALQL
ncbi:MAG: hypothetical protein AAFV37_07070, partial [Pseudomonadota bacterium]